MTLKRLTYHEEDGRFGVAGMNAENESEKVYACICKLKDYEDLGLSPDEVEQLVYKYDDLKREVEQLKKGIDPIREFYL